jgi:hypothetical protein
MKCSIAYALLLVYVLCKTKAHGYIFIIIGKTAPFEWHTSLEDSARFVLCISASRFASILQQ